jgi:hypothetical protein
MVVESPFNGTDVPVLVGGKPSGETMAIKTVDDHHWTTVLKFNGQQFGISRLELSLDGKTLTVENNITSAAAGQPGQGSQRYAYQAGLGIGQLKKKHDWQVDIWYQHADQFSLDPNLVDSDIFDSRVNMQGFAVFFGYQITDAVYASLQYAHGNQVDTTLGTGGVGDLGINPVDDYNLFQADLGWKF